VIRGLLSDEEWEFFRPFVAKRGCSGGRPPRDHRRVLDAVFWIARTGAPWRDLPSELGNWNSVWRQFRRWTESGIWDVLLQALADGGGDADALQMIDSTIVRAHHCAAGAKGGFKTKVLAARAVASRPTSTFAPTARACPSAWF
jgi:transposase